MLITLQQIISGRHLWKTGRGIISPFVEVEVLGSDHKTPHFSHLFKTRTVRKYHISNYDVLIKWLMFWLFLLSRG